MLEVQWAGSLPLHTHGPSHTPHAGETGLQAGRELHQVCACNPASQGFQERPDDMSSGVSWCRQASWPAPPGQTLIQLLAAGAGASDRALARRGNTR